MDFEMISPDAVDEYRKNPDVLLIDLRSDEEFRNAHIEGAIRISYNQITANCILPENRVLVLYCERGASSFLAAQKLAEKGYHVKAVVGGIRAYLRKITD